MAEARLCQSHKHILPEGSAWICAEFRGQVRAAGEGESTWVVVLEIFPHFGVLGLMMAGCIVRALPGDPALM